MITLTLLQHYWWFLISLLAAVLVFLLFVQGGQSLLGTLARSDEERTMLINSVGRKWEFTFTTLVVFGGGFFASFPLFYSTSFSGAFYVWMLLLLVFVIQAVSFQFRRKAGNLLGERTYNTFLQINGIAGPLLLGTIVGTFFTGAPFTVDRLRIVQAHGSTAISQWTTPWHGLEALADYRNIALGLAVFFLARMLASHYFLNDIDDDTVRGRARRQSVRSAAAFLVTFGVFFVSVLFADGYAVDPRTGIIAAEPYKYLHNFVQMPYVTALLLAGVVLLLCGIAAGGRGSRRAIWYSGPGTVAAVLGLLLCAGWNHTAYYPSLADVQSSLTIANSSSSEFTLRVMSIVSLAIPIVIGYIWYSWRALNRRPITREELRGDNHVY